MSDLTYQSCTHWVSRFKLVLLTLTHWYVRMQTYKGHRSTLYCCYTSDLIQPECFYYVSYRRTSYVICKLFSLLKHLSPDASDNRLATADSICHPWLRSAFVHVLRARARLNESTRNILKACCLVALSASSYLWCYCFSHSRLSLRSALLCRNNANLTESIFAHQTWWKFKSFIILCADCFCIFCHAFCNKNLMNPVLFMKITCENLQ